MGPLSLHEEELLRRIREAGLPEPVRELRFCDTRRWRFDLAWPDYALAVEIEGGIYVRGRHNRPAGFTRDAEKYNTACLFGWRVLRYSPEHIRNGTALKEIVMALRQTPTMPSVREKGERDGDVSCDRCEQHPQSRQPG